jgi:hypothetical protein
MSKCKITFFIILNLKLEYLGYFPGKLLLVKRQLKKHSPGINRKVKNFLPTDTFGVRENLAENSVMAVPPRE